MGPGTVCGVGMSQGAGAGSSLQAVLHSDPVGPDWGSVRGKAISLAALSFWWTAVSSVSAVHLGSPSKAHISTAPMFAVRLLPSGETFPPLCLLVVMGNANWK